jgi:hypothetical protein
LIYEKGIVLSYFEQELTNSAIISAVIVDAISVFPVTENKGQSIQLTE